MPSTVQRGVHVVVDISLALHFAAAALWWWLSPKGFPVGSSQFWTNSFLPPVVMVVAGIGLFAIHIRQQAVAAAVVFCFAAAWMSAAATGRIVFPLSMAWLWLPMLTISLAGWTLAGFLLRDEHGQKRFSVTASVLGAVIGICVVYWQIPPAPTTVPWSAQRVASVPDSTTPTTALIPLGTDVAFDPGTECFIRQCGKLRIHCSPLLEFHRTSPDRFWSLLAPADSGTSRQFSGAIVAQGKRTLWYSDDARIEVGKQNADILELAAYSPVAHDTYSHLNSYCHLVVSGHQSLALTFSPCADVLVDALPADYPHGRPVRFAYLDETQMFRVCEATSGEKGPFRPLATGALQTGEPLVIGLHDEGIQVASIMLEDWSLQASTAISPSAGWGVPVNAIEFKRVGDRSSAQVSIWITLSATAVGRGFETVGHAAGTYRNRLTIRRTESDIQP